MNVTGEIFTVPMSQPAFNIIFGFSSNSVIDQFHGDNQTPWGCYIHCTRFQSIIQSNARASLSLCASLQAASTCTIFFCFQEAIRGSGWRGQTFANLDHRVGWKPLIIALLLWALGLYSVWILPLLVIIPLPALNRGERSGTKKYLESSS